MVLRASRSGATHSHRHFRTLHNTQMLRGRSAIDGNLQESHTADNGERLTRCALRIVVVDLRDLVFADDNTKGRGDRSPKAAERRTRECW